MLLLLNGPPGVGKSTLARRYADDHRQTVVVEIDAVRASLDGWRDDPGSMRVARDRALASVRETLAAGRDVVVPQYLGRLAFVDALAQVAGESGASFCHVIVAAPAAVVVDRFRLRRAEWGPLGADHPQADLADELIEAAVLDAVSRLSSVASQRPSVVVIAAGAGADEAYAALLAALGGEASDDIVGQPSGP